MKTVGHGFKQHEDLKTRNDKRVKNEKTTSFREMKIFFTLAHKQQHNTINTNSQDFTSNNLVEPRQDSTKGKGRQ